jgi:putative phosphoribosyl transferase
MGERRLGGILLVPRDAWAGVVFGHGRESGRLSPRNQSLAQVLHDAGLATLRFDLLEKEEAQDWRKLYDVELLAGRVQAAARWFGRLPELHGLPLGYFGAGIGAAAVLIAAARRPELVGAVVTRSGQVELAWGELPAITASTLMIVGAQDVDLLEINRQSLALLPGPKDLVVIPGATHLFLEPGTLDEVARHATQWFKKHLHPAARPRAVAGGKSAISSR